MKAHNYSLISACQPGQAHALRGTPAPPTKRGGASYLAAGLNVRLYITKFVPKLSQAADGRVV